MLLTPLTEQSIAELWETRAAWLNLIALGDLLAADELQLIDAEIIKRG